MESRRYRLNRATLGVCSDGGKRTCVTVPRNEIIEVQLASISEDKRTLEIKWGNRVLTIFREDLLERGTKA